MKNLFWVIAALVVVGGVYYVSQNKQAPAPAMMQKKQATTAQPAMAPVKTVELEAGSFYYKPNTITVKKGETVKIVMKAVSMMHDFNIDELKVKMPIVKNGNMGTVEFTANTAGTFEYYCSVGKHRQLGQVGTLTVTE